MFKINKTLGNLYVIKVYKFEIKEKKTCEKN